MTKRLPLQIKPCHGGGEATTSHRLPSSSFMAVTQGARPGPAPRAAGFPWHSLAAGPGAGCLLACPELAGAVTFNTKYLCPPTCPRRANGGK